MKIVNVASSAAFVIASCSVLAQLPPIQVTSPNPWNGSWKLDTKRSSPAASEAGVPQIYRLTLGPAVSREVTITWEIPELGEIVSGRTDGKPMPIHRTVPAPGLSLGVLCEGTSSLQYSVYRDRKLVGGGRMFLVDNGKAWVDLTWPEDRQDLASELVYVKQ
ncbi:MAG: hypothetical protein ACRYGF_13775 [Janthinobacterium lividum]